MKDKVVQYPMRFRDKLSGKTFDFEAMPGEVYEAGTPLCKATLLRDPTAATFELAGNDALPDRALAKLAGAVKMDSDTMQTLGISGGSFELQKAIKELSRFKRHKVGYFVELRGSSLEGLGSSGNGSNATPLSFDKIYTFAGGERVHNDQSLPLPPLSPGLGGYHALVRVRASYTMRLTSGTIEARSFRLLKDGARVADFGSNLVCEGYYPSAAAGGVTVFRQTYTASLNCVVEVADVGEPTLLTLGLIDSGSWGNSLKIEKGCIEEFAALIVD